MAVYVWKNEITTYLENLMPTQSRETSLEKNVSQLTDSLYHFTDRPNILTLSQSLMTRTLLRRENKLETYALLNPSQHPTTRNLSLYAPPKQKCRNTTASEIAI